MTGSFPRVVVIGGSAGALDALFRMLPLLREDIAFPVAVVLHRKHSDEGALETLLSAKTRLRVKEVEDKDALDAGTLHLAPADYHLLFEKDGTLALDYSEKVAFSRPSIDVAFSSAANAFGNGVAGMLLSGANSDGVDGLRAIKEGGGSTAVQSPESADMPVMPRAAIEAGVADTIADVEGLAQWLRSL